MAEFHWPNKTLVGPGLVKQLGEHVSPSVRVKRLFIVNPVEAWARLFNQRIQTQLEKAGWEQVDTFPEVEVAQVELPSLVARMLPDVNAKTNPMLATQEEI